MKQTILITGSQGLIGSAIAPRLSDDGYDVRPFDVRAEQAAHRGDVLDRHAIHEAARGCCGIIHLAAVSRVVCGERDPKLCTETNVDGTKNVITAALEASARPWILLASSREVYGQPQRLPATEDTQLRPMNVYARSKVDAERALVEARDAGARTAIVRFSNVYGSTADHADRVVPAFARAAAQGTTIRLEGAEHTFDFTHVDDVARGILRIVELLDRGESLLPPIHLVTGIPTTLSELAELAMEAGGNTLPIEHAPARSYDVARFYGDPSRAEALLAWRPRVSLRAGMSKLVNDYRASCREAS
ncbi:MAG TPA: NAD(P)-dependent oxidoreductase [Polyangiaceae bacterium]|nr:NAD(P)-dependent oxidoreductase [Polyangiaceae bacterium]